MTDTVIQPGDQLLIAPSLLPAASFFNPEQTCTVKRLRLMAGGEGALLISETHDGETRTAAVGKWRAVRGGWCGCCSLRPEMGRCYGDPVPADLLGQRGSPGALHITA